MDPQAFLDIATKITKLKMFPYFDVAHYILCCLSVRDDIPNVSGSGVAFSRKHPLSCWMSCLLVSNAGSIISSFLLGEPCLNSFKDHRAMITASIIWYLVFYSPFDIFYKLIKFLPVKLMIYPLKEVQRAHKVFHGVTYAAKIYPESYVIIIIIGTLKGAGSGLMKNFERLVRGVWIPGSNEILQPTFTTKACFIAALVFLLERLGYITAPHAAIYFGVVIFFVYFKLSAILLGIIDPFHPFENLFCAVFMGGMWDALKKAVIREPRREDDNKEIKNDISKSKDDKKRD